MYDNNNLSMNSIITYLIHSLRVVSIFSLSFWKAGAEENQLFLQETKLHDNADSRVV